MCRQVFRPDSYEGACIRQVGTLGGAGGAGAVRSFDLTVTKTLCIRQVETPDGTGTREAPDGSCE